MKFHPLCELFPQMNTAEICDLGEDIKANKQNDPILLFDGKILDGRNRYLACQLVKVKPRFENFTGNETAALSLVISKNLKRRQLTESQLAMVAADIANLKIGETKSNAPSGASQADAAEKVGVSRRAVQRASRVKKDGTKAVQDMVRKGDVSVNAADKVAANLTKKKQRKLAARGAEAVNKAARQFGSYSPEKKMDANFYINAPASKSEEPAEHVCKCGVCGRKME